MRQVVALVGKCSESNGEQVQLAVIRALLTVTTAEHFVLHGDCLMQVRWGALPLYAANQSAGSWLARRPGMLIAESDPWSGSS